MLIFIQRGTSVPFFLRFFRGFAPFRRFGTEKDSRFGCGRVTADSSGLPLWCGERLLRQGILTVLSLYSSVECAGVKRICFCCGQKERNATKERKAQSKRNRSGFPAALTRRKIPASAAGGGNGRQFGVVALVRRKSFTAGGFWLCPNDNGGGGDSCLRCRRKPYI